MAEPSVRKRIKEIAKNLSEDFYKQELSQMPPALNKFFLQTLDACSQDEDWLKDHRIPYNHNPTYYYDVARELLIDYWMFIKN